MQTHNPSDNQLTGKREYRWMPFMYISYAVCVIVLMSFIPLEDEMKMLVLILMTTVYIGAISGLTARALQRIEQRLDNLS